MRAAPRRSDHLLPFANPKGILSMNKLPVFGAAFGAAVFVSFSCLAADPAPAPAAASEAAPKAVAPAKPRDEKSQHDRLKSLQATCNARADAHKLAGDARKASIAKCLEGK
jgi:hypothetical protein